MNQIILLFLSMSLSQIALSEEIICTTDYGDQNFIVHNETIDRISSENISESYKIIKNSDDIIVARYSSRSIKLYERHTFKYFRKESRVKINYFFRAWLGEVWIPFPRPQPGDDDTWGGTILPIPFPLISIEKDEYDNCKWVE